MQAHGNTGAFVGGDWIPIEEVGERFLCSGKTTSTDVYRARCGGDCAACPNNRSRTKHSSVGPDGIYDVVIIGAGVVGCATARELAKTKARVLVVDAADDVTQGASKANSGVIHAGYDCVPGSARGFYNSRGCKLYPKLDEELHFGFRKCGSLVLARSEADLVTLDELLRRGIANGVDNLEIIHGNEAIQKFEPHVSPDVIAALWAKDAGLVIPYEYCIALAENAADNGVEINLRTEVVGINSVNLPGTNAATPTGFQINVLRWTPKTSDPRKSPVEGGHAAVADSATPMKGQAKEGTPPTPEADRNHPSHPHQHYHESIEQQQPGYQYSPSRGTYLEGVSTKDVILARYIINCAGINSDKIATMIGDNRFKIEPRYGDYLLLHKREGHRANMILFPCPDPHKGKGILVQSTLWGNLLVGPTARDVPRDEQLMRPPHDSEAIEKHLLQKSRDLVKDYDETLTIHSYAGIRAKPSTGDWIVGPSPTNQRVIIAGGIDSPGLASSPALAVAMVQMLIEIGAQNNDLQRIVTANVEFNPHRKPIIVPKTKPAKGSKDALGNTLIFDHEARQKGHNAESTVICFCERVTEAEIVECIKRSLPVDSTQAVRRRCRAGMGQCQGRQCEEKVAHIVARETGIPTADIGRRPWPASSLLPRRWLSKSDREELHRLSASKL